MKPKTLKEWINIYEEKTQDRAGLPNDSYCLIYLATRGFMIYKLMPDMVFVYQVCGDGNFWRDYAELLCRQNGLHIVGTICTRNLKAYLKSFGGEILAEQEINGEKRLLCQDCLGRKVICTHKTMGEKTGIPEYWVTNYLDEKATTSFDRMEVKENVEN